MNILLIQFLFNLFSLLFSQYLVIITSYQLKNGAPFIYFGFGSIQQDPDRLSLLYITFQRFIIIPDACQFVPQTTTININILISMFKNSFQQNSCMFSSLIKNRSIQFFHSQLLQPVLILLKFWSLFYTYHISAFIHSTSIKKALFLH